MAKNSMTAAELMAELADNPEYQRKIQEKEEARAATEAKLRREESMLVRELQETGICIVLDRIPGQEYSGPPRSISDLVNTNSSYVEAIAVLVKHLQLEYSRPIKESIVRSLVSPESKGNAGVLIRMFEAEADSESELKWLIGAAIAESATESDADKIIELANDECHGRGREFLPLGLVHTSKEKALPVLSGWLNTPVLGENASKAIKLLG